MYCKNCGHQILEGAQFCQNCGASVDTPHNNSNNNKFLFAIIAIILVLAGGYFIINSNSRSKVNEQQKISSVDKKEEEIIQGQVNSLIEWDNVNNCDWVESSQEYSKNGELKVLELIDKNNIILDSKNRILYYPFLFTSHASDSPYSVLVITKVDLKERIATDLALHMVAKPSAKSPISDIKRYLPSARQVGELFIVETDNFVKKGTTKPRFINVDTRLEVSVLKAYKLKTGKILSFDKQ